MSFPRLPSPQKEHTSDAWFRQTRLWSCDWRPLLRRHLISMVTLKARNIVSQFLLLLHQENAISVWRDGLYSLVLDPWWTDTSRNLQDFLVLYTHLLLYCMCPHKTGKQQWKLTVLLGTLFNNKRRNTWLRAITHMLLSTLGRCSTTAQRGDLQLQPCYDPDLLYNIFIRIGWC